MSAAELDRLTDADHELIDLARRTIEDNHDDHEPGGGAHTMGAAVRDATGRMHAGVNLYHFTGGPCAELVALATARASGARKVSTIVAVGHEGAGVVGPCGRDRQVLFDYHPGIRVLLPTNEGVRATIIEYLMPFNAAWRIDGGTQPYDPERFAR